MSSLKRTIEEYGIKNIVNYLRKSRQDEDRERKTGEDTLHEQKQLMDRVLSSYGVPYVQESEIGSGDKISSRPVFQKVIRKLEQGLYDAIAVKEISRMGRGSYTDMGTIYDLIVEKRIYIITPYKIYDPTNPSDLRQIRFELFMSREEFETTRERLTGGRYNAAMEGKWVAGPAPFGYDYDPTTKRLVINDEEAEIVRLIFDFYANGIILKNGKRKLVQFRAMCTYLKRIGIKTMRGKDEWHPVRLKEFLSNERYIGTLIFRTTQRLADGKVVARPESEHIVVEHAHEAIVDDETWNKVQDRINNRQPTTNTKLDFEPCELAGLCVCKVCGHKMVRQSSTQHYKKKDGTTSVYHKEFLWCRTVGCTFVKYRNVENDILMTFNELKSLDDETLTSFLKSIKPTKKDDESREELAKHLEMKKTELKRRLDFIFDKYESGVYSDEEFLSRKVVIEEELKSLKGIKIDAPKKEIENRIDVDAFRNNIHSVLQIYHKTENKSTKNKILHEVIDNVVVEVLEKGRGRKQAVHEIFVELKYDFVSKK